MFGRTLVSKISLLCFISLVYFYNNTSSSFTLSLDGAKIIKLSFSFRRDGTEAEALPNRP